MYIKGDFGSKVCGSFLLYIFRICHAVLSVNWSLVVTCWERANLLATLYVMFSCVFVTFPCGVLGTWMYRFLIFVFFLTLFMLWSVKKAAARANIVWPTLQVFSSENSQHGPTEFEHVSIQKKSRTILSLKIKLDRSRWYTIAHTRFFTFNLDPNFTLTLGSR